MSATRHKLNLLTQERSFCARAWVPQRHCLIIDRSDGHRPQEARWITEPGQKSGDRRIIGRRLAADKVISLRAADLSIRSASRQGAAVKAKSLAWGGDPVPQITASYREGLATLP